MNMDLRDMDFEVMWLIGLIQTCVPWPSSALAALKLLILLPQPCTSVHGVECWALKLHPWGRVLLENLIVTRVVKKFPAFYGSQSFITVFTTVFHLSYPVPDQSTPQLPTLFSW